MMMILLRNYLTVAMKSSRRLGDYLFLMSQRSKLFLPQLTSSIPARPLLEVPAVQLLSLRNLLKRMLSGFISTLLVLSIMPPEPRLLFASTAMALVSRPSLTTSSRTSRSEMNEIKRYYTFNL